MLWVKTEQVCATCAMWAGKRKQTYSFVEPVDTEAECQVDRNKTTLHKCACQLWYGLPFEIPNSTEYQKEPVSVR